MTPLNTPFSEAGKAQIELMRALTIQAFANAEQLINLSISTSRAAIERSAGTFMQLASLSDPRDLFALGAHAQDQFQSMVSFGNELFRITTGARLTLPRAPQAAPREQAPLPAQAAQATPEPAARPSGEHILPAALNDIGTAPPVEPKAIVQTLAEVTDQPLAVPHPDAAPVAAPVAARPIVEVEAAPVKPVLADKPAPAPRTRQAPAKGGRKK